MRGALVCVIVGLLVSTVRADPFDVRNPVPDAPPSTTTIDPFATKPVEILDPGYSQRRLGVGFAIGGGVFLAGSLVLSRAMARRYDAALDRLDHLDAGDSPASAIDDANHAQHVAKVWGTTLFAAGTLALGASLVLYVTAPAKIRREQLVIAPAVDRDGAGVAISGGF